MLCINPCQSLVRMYPQGWSWMSFLVFVYRGNLDFNSQRKLLWKMPYTLKVGRPFMESSPISHIHTSTITQDSQTRPYWIYVENSGFLGMLSNVHLTPQLNLERGWLYEYIHMAGGGDSQESKRTKVLNGTKDLKTLPIISASAP